MEAGEARQHGDLAGLLDGECAGPGQVRHAQPQLQAQGREGLAEVREGAQAEGGDRQDPRGVHGRPQVQGDEDQAESRGPLLHRQVGSQSRYGFN